MKKRSMKKLLAFTSVLMLFLCCFSSAAVAGCGGMRPFPFRSISLRSR